VYNRPPKPSKLYKFLISPLSKTGGRNNTGRITSRYIGGGHKKSYRMVDFKRNKVDMTATVQRIEYDPCRTSFIALIKYEDGILSYILATSNMKSGDLVVSSDEAMHSDGNCMLLENIMVGSLVHNVEMKPGKGGQISRSAGSFVRVIAKDGGFAKLKLQSSEIRLVSLSCKATLGVLSNLDHKNSICGKAGRSRWSGTRPSVRGVAKNPVDHPHGGGEGKTSGGRHPVTPWGVSTKGYKTRSNNFTSKYIIKRRKV
jgi:large subunit ribosomal protein L2